MSMTLLRNSSVSWKIRYNFIAVKLYFYSNCNWHRLCPELKQAGHLLQWCVLHVLHVKHYMCFLSSGSRKKHLFLVFFFVFFIIIVGCLRPSVFSMTGYGQRNLSNCSVSLLYGFKHFLAPRKILQEKGDCWQLEIDSLIFLFFFWLVQRFNAFCRTRPTLKQTVSSKFCFLSSRSVTVPISKQLALRNDSLAI